MENENILVYYGFVRYLPWNSLLRILARNCMKLWTMGSESNMEECTFEGKYISKKKESQCLEDSMNSSN
jgi:hypothetical protein